MKDSATSKKVPRPPVVAVLGHIDHGKSTLLDSIRASNIVDKEVGGITQNMSAYEVEKDGKKITFLDTPGHEAFQKLRGQGARLADVGILVVSAEDGVKQQTIEALKAITEAKLPYIVAINKIDKEGADIERTKQSLLENEIYVEGYGGSIPFVSISAKTGKGIPELLDMISLLSEMEELTADTSTHASGVVIETNHKKTRGVSATVLIKTGILKTGMFVVSEEASAPVRIFLNVLGKPIKEATFSAPVTVVGWDDIPRVGSTFESYASRKEAEKAIEEYKNNKADNLKATPKKALPAVFVPVLIKADTSGVLEAIEHEIRKYETEQIGVNIVYAGVGDISESDIKLASGNEKTLVVGFNTKIYPSALFHAEKIGIEIKVFDIIYKLGDWIKEIILERTPRVEVEEERGKIKVLKIFSKTKDKQIIGGRVEIGSIVLNDEVKIFRRDAEIGLGRVRELQQAKSKTEEVKEGLEFGSMVESKIEIAPGDYLKPVVMVTK